MKLLVRNMKIGLVFLSFQVMCLSTVNAAYYKWTDEEKAT